PCADSGVSPLPASPPEAAGPFFGEGGRNDPSSPPAYAPAAYVRSRRGFERGPGMRLRTSGLAGPEDLHRFAFPLPASRHRTGRRRAGHAGYGTAMADNGGERGRFQTEPARTAAGYASAA